MLLGPSVQMPVAALRLQPAARPAATGLVRAAAPVGSVQLGQPRHEGLGVAAVAAPALDARHADGHALARPVLHVQRVRHQRAGGKEALCVAA